MEVISIDGVEYVRASQIARKYRYTSDYIGQLCRSGKVAAKLVGRTWYVNPDSVEGHKQGRYQKVSGDEKNSNSDTKKTISRIDVEAVPRADTVKTIKQVSSAAPQYLRRIEWKPVKYEQDNSELLPPLKVNARPIEIPVEIAGAQSVKIRKSSEHTQLEAEPLPEVALRGSLKVASADDDFAVSDDAENRFENIAISSDDDADASVRLHPSSTDRRRAVAIDIVEEEDSIESDTQPHSQREDDPYRYDVPVSVQRTSFAPRRVTAQERAEAQAEVATRSISFVWAAVMLVGVFLILASAVFGLSVEWSATADTVSTTYIFDPGI